MKTINTLIPTLALSLLFFLVSGVSRVHAANCAVSFETAGVVQGVNSTSEGITNKNLAVRCYKRCWVDGRGRHCNTVCN